LIIGALALLINVLLMWSETEILLVIGYLEWKEGKNMLKTSKQVFRVQSRLSYTNNMINQSIIRPISFSTYCFL
jgi:hypothetical protein